MNFLNATKNRWLLGIASLLVLGIVISPLASLDAILIALLALGIGHLFLGERLILAFLVIRPALDYWRDISLFTYQNLTINVNSALGLLFFLWAIIVLIPRWRALIQQPLFWLLFIFSTLIVGSAAYSVSPLLTLNESLKFLNLATLFLLAYILVSEKKLHLHQVLVATLLSAVIPLLFGFYQLIAGSGISTFGINGRIYGTFGHPNVLAFFCLLLLSTWFYWTKHRPTEYWKSRPELLWLIGGIITFQMIMTYTRAAWIGLIIFIIIIGLLYYRALALKTILSIVIFYALFFPINELIISRTNYNLQEVPLLSRLTSRNEEADSWAWRQSLVRETIPIIEARPWFGYGYGTFPLVWGDNRNLSHLWDDSAQAHNDYLRITLETGLVGLIIYDIFLLSLLYFSLRLTIPTHRPDEIFLPALVITFMVMSVSDNMLYHTPVMWLWWSIWGASIAEFSNKKTA